MFIEELCTMLPSGYVFGTNVFGSSMAVLPAASAPVSLTGFLQITETGGTGPERTHNSVIRPAYVRPSAQFVAHAKEYTMARRVAYDAYDALVQIRNYTASGGVFYREINPLQEPFDLDPDQAGRARVAFNIAVIKRPS